MTAITTLGLIVTVTSGYFGMNMNPFGEGSIEERALHGAVATVVFVGLTPFAIPRSTRLSDFVETLADERVPFGKTVIAQGRVLRSGRRR